MLKSKRVDATETILANRAQEMVMKDVTTNQVPSNPLVFWVRVFLNIMQSSLRLPSALMITRGSTVIQPTFIASDR